MSFIFCISLYITSLILILIILKFILFIHFESKKDLISQKKQAQYRKARLPNKNKDLALYTTEEKIAIEGDLKYHLYLKERFFIRIIILSIFIPVFMIYSIYAMTFLADKYIKEQDIIAKKGVVWYPIKNCREKIKVSGDSDGEIQSSYEREFYKHCIKHSDVICTFGDVVFRDDPIRCRRYNQTLHAPLAKLILNNYPFKFFIKYL